MGEVARARDLVWRGFLGPRCCKPRCQFWVQAGVPKRGTGGWAVPSELQQWLISRGFWCRRRDRTQPPAYKADALPLSYAGRRSLPGIAGRRARRRGRSVGSVSLRCAGAMAVGDTSRLRPPGVCPHRGHRPRARPRRDGSTAGIGLAGAERGRHGGVDPAAAGGMKDHQEEHRWRRTRSGCGRVCRIRLARPGTVPAPTSRAVLGACREGRAVPVRRRRRARDPRGSRCPSSPTRSGMATCRMRARGSSTATGCTGRTTRSPGTASITQAAARPSPRRFGHSALARCRVRPSARRSQGGSVVRPPRQRAVHAQMSGHRSGVHLGTRPPDPATVA